MAEVNDQQAPQGIVTYNMIYSSINKLINRVDDLEKRIIRLEIKPEPVTKVEAVGKEIKKVKK